MAITSEQVTAARKLLGWSQMGLALKAGINAKTVAQLETGQRRQIARTVLAIQRTLEIAGVEFVAGQPGVRLRKG